MKPCDLIDGASYGPETLKAMTQAFDAAWREIGSSFGNDARDIQKARLQLARAVSEGQGLRDLEAARQEAIAGLRDIVAERIRSGEPVSFSQRIEIASE